MESEKAAMTDENPNPQEALASIQAARATVGQTLDYPVAWDLLYGLILAVMIGGAGLDQPWSALTLFGSLGALFFMVRWWRKRTGWWVSGYSPPKARWVAVGLAVVIMGLMGLSFWTRFGDGAWWLPIVAGGLAGVAGIIGGRLWMHVYRKELQGEGR